VGNVRQKSLLINKLSSRVTYWCPKCQH
jgi:formamidopyrimidine-DNA glycosylase